MMPTYVEQKLQQIPDNILIVKVIVSFSLISQPFENASFRCGQLILSSFDVTSVFDFPNVTSIHCTIQTEKETESFFELKAMLHEAIFLATCNATMTNKKPFKLQRGCYTQATCLATLRKLEGRSTFLTTRNATIAVAKWGVTREFFLATCNATFVALQDARKIASCNMALTFLRIRFFPQRKINICTKLN